MKGIAVEARRLRVGEIDTSVLEAGQGPPVLLLHGGIECGGVYWAPVISRLAERYRVIVPDVPGLGESAPAGRMDTGAFATWFAALLRLTCSERPTLVAHSLLGVKRTMRQLIKAGTRQIPDTTLRRIETPTELLWGRHDRMTPLRLAESAGTKLGWPLHVIDDAGHVPHIEQPKRFLAALYSALGT